MHGSSVVPMLEKFIPSLGVVLNSKYIIITSRPYLSLMSNVPSKSSILKKAFPHHLFSFVGIPCTVIECEIISLYPNGTRCDPSNISRSQVLERLLHWELWGFFFSKIPCCPSSGFQGPFCPDLGLLTMPCRWKNPKLLGPTPQSQNLCMCNGFWNVCRAHETFSIQVKHFGIRV